MHPHLPWLSLTADTANFSPSRTQGFAGKAVAGVVQNQAGKRAIRMTKGVVCKLISWAFLI